MKRVVLFLISFFALVNAFAEINVVTSTSDLASIAQAIGGEKAKVVSLNPGTRDPHFAEAKPSMIRQVASADMLVVIGADLEIGWLPPLLQTARNSRVNYGGAGFLDISRFVELKDKKTGSVDRSQGDVHVLGNPHYWLDPANGLKIAAAIVAKLKAIDAANADYYQQRADEFNKQLTVEMKTWAAELGFMAGRKVIAYHTSLLYLANAYKFEIVNYIEPKPGIAPSAAHLDDLLRTIKEQKVDMIIMEPHYERKSAAYLRNKTGIAVGIIPQSVGARADASDYFHLFDAIVHALKHPGDV